MALTSRGMHDVGELIGYALRLKHRPGADSQYRILLDRYRTDAEFRLAVDSVMDGLQMRVLSASPFGLVLGVRRESVFAYRLTDLPNVTTVERRLVAGLIHVAIAAYAFPTPADLDDDRVRWVSVADIERFIRDSCTALSRAEDATGDRAGGGAAGDGELPDDIVEAWKVYEAMPSVYVPAKGRTAGRRSPECTTYWVDNVLTWLTDQGLARPAPDRGTETFQLLERFRVQVRELAGHAAYEALREMRRAEAPTAATPDTPTAETDPAAGTDAPAAGTGTTARDEDGEAA